MSPEEHNDLELKLIGSGQYPEFTDDDINALRLALDLKVSILVVSRTPGCTSYLLIRRNHKRFAFGFWEYLLAD